MAIDAGKVVAMLELDTSGFSSGLSSAQNLLRVWDSNTASLGDKLTATGAAATTLGKTLSTAVTLPLAGLGTAAVKTFTSFDDAIRQVRATMNASEEDTEKLTAAAKKLGAETRYTASDAAEALNYLALAGYNADKAIEALPTVLNLAQAGALDLGYASTLLTDSMSSLGIGMSEVSGFADQIAVTSQKSNTNIAQLGEAILTIGGTAKSLAGGTVELNTELGILADNGIKGAEGGTHLRNVLLSLQTPTTEGAAYLNALTNGVYDADGSMRSLDTILQELNASMASMTDAEKQSIISTIFNKTDLAAVQALLAGCGERYAELSSYIEGSSGAAQEMADTMEGGIGGSFRNLESAVEALGIAFGESLEPTVKSITDFITNLTLQFSSLSEGTRETIVQVAAFAAAVGPVLLVGGKLITLFGTLANAMTGPAGWITLGVAGVAALIAAFKALDNTKVAPGITTEELENYKLDSDTVDLGTVTAEFELEVQNKGKSAYELIKEIMNDGVPESEKDYAQMADAVNEVIAASMDAIVNNYNTKKAALDELLAAGVIDEKSYNERTATLEADTQATKDALTADATAVTDYVQALIAANAPMTEQQLAYLQELIDKLVETSTQAGLAADAVMDGYKLSYKRSANGMALEGDTERAAQYIETSYASKLKLAQDAQAQEQADTAAELAQFAEGSDEYNAILEKSVEQAKAWDEVYANLEEERQSMYAELATGAMSGMDQETLDNIERYSELLKLQRTYEELEANRPGADASDEEWDAWEEQYDEAKTQQYMLGVTNMTQSLTEMSEALDGVDVDQLKDVMGYLYANDETLDASQLETLPGLLVAANDLISAVDTINNTSVDTEGITRQITTAQAPVVAAVDVVTGAAVEAADVSDGMETQGENSAEGYVQGWVKKEPYIKSTIQRIMEAVGGTTARVLAIQSPSKVMRKLGGYTAEGFALGIKDNETLVRAATTSMAGAATDVKTGGGVSGRNGTAITLNLNNATIRSDEDARTLARILGGYVASMNYGV